MKNVRLFIPVVLFALFLTAGCRFDPASPESGSQQVIVRSDSLPVMHNIDSLFAIFVRAEGRAHVQAANVLSRNIYELGHIYSDTVFAENVSVTGCDAHIYGAMALYKLDHGDYASAISFNRQSLELYRELCDSLRIVYKLQNLYVNYSLTGQYEHALACLDESLEIATTIGDEPMIANTLLCMGDLHHRNGHNEIAAGYFEKGYERYVRLGNVKRIITSLVGLSVANRELDYTDEAYRYALKSDSLSRENGNDFSRIESLGTLATAYQKMEEWEKALACLDESRGICERLDRKSSLANVLCWTGEVHFKSGKNPKKAEEYLKRNIAIGEEINKPDVLNEAYEYLYKLYKSCHNNALALEALEKNVGMKNRLYREEIQEQLGNFHVRYETQEKEHRIIMQEKDISRHKMTNKLILCIGILAVIIMSILYRYMRGRKRYAEQQKLLAENKVKQLEQETQLVATQAILDGETQASPATCTTDWAVS
ncbi:MAG: tetratricopeptide repeat protein [Tannerella sp.]|jgi:tetratricopeptide (TPR) repeat protein|nr:tetratricopeptide repeat protein [Tannerella sp.]